jgi:sigma-B regulation protein RsbU (phosphoserine phosphatase)
VGGPILGVFESATYPSGTVMLAPGDTVVCYSDGVTDAESPSGSHFGLDRFIDAIRVRGAAAPPQFVEKLLSAVRAFAGTASSVDDATIAALRYR